MMTESTLPASMWGRISGFDIQFESFGDDLIVAMYRRWTHFPSAYSLVG